MGRGLIYRACRAEEKRSAPRDARLYYSGKSQFLGHGGREVFELLPWHGGIPQAWRARSIRAPTLAKTVQRRRTVLGDAPTPIATGFPRMDGDQNLLYIQATICCA